MKRIAKRVGWFVAALAVICLIWLVWERISGIRHLNAYLKSLREAGEKLEVSELEPRSRPDPFNNAALALRALSNRFDSISDLRKVFPPSGRSASPGKAIVPHRLAQWYWDKKTTNTWEKLEIALQQHQDDLEAIHAALEKPGYDLNVDYHGDFDQPDSKALVTAKKTSELLATAAFNEVRLGRFPAAQPHLLTSARLAALLGNEQLLITQLVRQAVVTINYHAVWAILLENDWTDEQLAALQRTWTTLDLISDFQKALEMERDMAINYFKRVEDTPGKLSQEVGQPDFFRPSDEDSEWQDTVLSRLRPLQCLAWRWVWKEQDLLRNLEWTQKLVERSRTARAKGFFTLV